MKRLWRLSSWLEAWFVWLVVTGISWAVSLVLALSIAGMLASGTTIIDTAEAVSVTYPDYVDAMRQLGANVRIQ